MLILLPVIIVYIILLDIVLLMWFDENKEIKFILFINSCILLISLYIKIKCGHLAKDIEGLNTLISIYFTVSVVCYLTRAKLKEEVVRIFKVNINIYFIYHILIIIDFIFLLVILYLQIKLVCSPTMEYKLNMTSFDILGLIFNILGAWLDDIFIVLQRLSQKRKRM